MKQYAATNKVLFSKPTPHGWDIVTVASESNPNKKYTVDLTHGRCSCPAWIHQKGGDRQPCKHLRRLGFTRVVTAADMEFKEPNKTKAPKEKIDLTIYQEAM